MLAKTQDLLLAAEKGGYAIAAFNAPNLSTIEAVCEAAEEENMPIILSHGEGHEPYAHLETIAPIMMRFAKEAKVPISVHLDHGDGGNHEEYIYRAMRCGFTSVMADFSECGFEENIARLKKVVEVAHDLGVAVEGMYGEMPSNIEGFGRMGRGEVGKDFDISEFFTKPENSAEFVERSGIDSMVVSFGSVHGFYVENPKMDFDCLKNVKAALPNTPLVMHGGSGLDDADVRKCIDFGIRKINYYTYMSTIPAKKLPAWMAEQQAKNHVPWFHEIAEFSKKVMKDQAKQVIQLFKNGK